MWFFEVVIVLILITALLFVLGRYTVWLPTRPQAWPRLLMLHQVNPDLPPSGMNMPPARFEKLLQHLQKQHYRTVTVSELVQATEHQHLIAITFDDGFADNFDYAFPLLQKYQAKATIYLAPDIKGIAKLTVEQIQQMQASGLIEFGAHTLHHCNLTQLSLADAEAEIRGSRQRVTELVGYCHSFAYPFGRFAPEHQTLVEAAGYSSAVSTRKRIEPLSADNRFRLPRISTNGVMDGWQLRIALAKGRYRI